MEFIKTSSGKLINKAFIVCADEGTITTSNGASYDIDEGAFFDPIVYETVPASPNDIALVVEIAHHKGTGKIYHHTKRVKIIAWRVEEFITTPLLSTGSHGGDVVGVIHPGGGVFCVDYGECSSEEEFVSSVVAGYAERNGLTLPE